MNEPEDSRAPLDEAVLAGLDSLADADQDAALAVLVLSTAINALVETAGPEQRAGVAAVMDRLAERLAAEARKGARHEASWLRAAAKATSVAAIARPAPDVRPPVAPGPRP